MPRGTIRASENYIAGELATVPLSIPHSQFTAVTMAARVGTVVGGGLQVPITGVYIVSFGIEWQYHVNGDYREVQLRTQDSTPARSTYRFLQRGTDNGRAQFGTKILKVSGGNFIDMLVAQTSGVALNVDLATVEAVRIG